MLADTNASGPSAAQSPVHLLRRNAARSGSRTAAIDPPTLLQFVLLSMLLHLLLVVLFGNPTGGARRDEAWWGPLDVTLRPPSPEPGSAFRLAPGAETNLPGSTLLQPAASAPRVPAQSQRRNAEPAPVAPAPGDTLPNLNPSAPEEVNKSLAPPIVAPATVEPVAPTAQPRPVAPEVVPRVTPALPVLPIEKSVAPTSESQLAPPIELAPRAIPAAPAAPLERAAPPPVERELAPATEVPVPVAPAVPETTPIERLAPAPIEREVAPPVQLPLRAAPAVPAAPIERMEPAKIETEVAPPVEAPASSAARPAAQSTPRPAPAGQTPQRLPSPDAGEELFKSRRDTETAPSEAPRIDLDAARKKAAREIVSEGTGSRGVFTVPSPPVEPKKKEAMPLEKALKPDCRTAYANLGLLAAPVLVANAIAADGGCRW